VRNNPDCNNVNRQQATNSMMPEGCVLKARFHQQISTV